MERFAPRLASNEPKEHIHRYNLETIPGTDKKQWRCAIRNCDKTLPFNGERFPPSP